LVLVPQLLLGGAMIKFDDLHKSITRKEYVPVIGDLMATRWAYEAIMVEGYKGNRYKKPTFDYALEINQNNYYKEELISNLRNEVINYILQKDTIPAEKRNIIKKLSILNYHINDLSNISGVKPGSWMNNLNYSDFNQRAADSVNKFFDKVYLRFVSDNKYFNSELYAVEQSVLGKIGVKGASMLATAYNNKQLEDIVLNQGNLREAPYYESDYKWIQKTKPIYMKPTSRIGRAQFYAPYKQIGNLQVDTLFFNMMAMWIMIILFFIALYYNLLQKFINYLESLKLPFWRKFGRQSL
jgi:hypothetical protein